MADGQFGEAPREREQGSIDERVAVAFWIALFGIATSFVGALVGVALHVDTTILEAGFIGAFLGGLPILFFPAVARATWGRETRLAIRQSFWFRLATVVWVGLVLGSRAIGFWPSHPQGSFAVSAAGLGGATLAAWYLPHFPRALRIWVRQQHPLPKILE
jgi:hypothetical protein